MLGGSLRELVVAHQDRLSRLAFGLIEFLIAEVGGQLVVHDSGGVSENDELGEDLLSIVHIFLCRQYGRRKYGKRRGASRETTTKKAKKVAARGAVIWGRKIWNVPAKEQNEILRKCLRIHRHIYNE